MSNIVHLMGPTCAGKSTLITRLLNIAPEIVGAVEVGKMMRAKYLDPASPHYQPDFFKGQAAPLHTQAEAWSMYQEGVNRCIEQGKRMVLVDGQPRDIQQARDVVGLWKSPHRASYLMIHAAQEVRNERAAATRQGDALALALQRMEGDYKNCYVVLAELELRNEVVRWFDTTEDVNAHALAEHLLAEYGQ